MRQYNTQAAALAIDASKSLARRRLRFNAGQGAFDHPAPRQQLKSGGRRSAFDDLDRPIAEFDQRRTQVGTLVDTVGKEVAQPGKQIVDGFDDEPGTVAVLDVGGMDHDTTSKPEVSVTT